MRHVWLLGKNLLQGGCDWFDDCRLPTAGFKSKISPLVAFVLAMVLAGSTLGADDPSLVVYYSFDNIGATVADQSGKGHNATVQGAVTADPGGKHNGAAKFAGGYLDLDGPNFARGDIPTSAITLATWVKCDYTGKHHAIFDARTDAGTWIIHPELRSDGRFRWALRAHGMRVIFGMQAGSVTWGQWLHYAATYDKEAGKAVLYVDGQVVSQLDLPAGTDIGGDWGDGARVGPSIGNARAFTGLMDDSHLFKRALPPSEVKRIMYGPGWPYASSPNPADGATLAATSVRLDWSAGQSAASHRVYLGEIFDDVNNGTAGTSYGSQSSTSFVVGLPGYAYPQGLVPGTTYYWRIDEVQASGTLHKGDVWSFTTAGFFVVDDFESYNDTDPPNPLSSTIFAGWADGYQKDENGALIGNSLPPYAEQDVVHGGLPSMPYHDEADRKYAEATHTIAYPHDWTQKGAETLSVWFKGDYVNDAVPMYVAIASANGVSAAVNHDDSEAMRLLSGSAPKAT